jgi:1,2-diacylglycerol 3-alpha-glucosyltransferase
MRILHVCLAAFYIDNYGYQENILPKMHMLSGNTVMILASTETYINLKIGYTKASRYINEDKIPVIRIPYNKFIPKSINKKIRIYSGIKKVLKDFKPDIIFMHDLQFMSIFVFRRYLKKNRNVKLYIDGHTDFINSGRNWLSKNVLHKVIYRICAKAIEQYTEKFYGVLPIRCDFFIDVYKIPNNKVELLPLGFDDTIINKLDLKSVHQNVRLRLNINPDDFIIISGGKIDKRKNIHNLIDAFISLNLPNLKLIIFGSPNDEMQAYIKDVVSNDKIFYLGWQSTQEIIELMVSSDLAIFPGTHSVLWEQSIGIGLPTVLKKWDGMTHYDLGGNCIFLQNGSKDEIIEVLRELNDDKTKFRNMKLVASGPAKEYFSYSKIAEKSISS